MNKKHFFIIILSFIFFCSPARSFAESIQSFNSDIVVNLKDNNALITETILYDFGDLQRHGIFREIPKTFKPQGLLTTSDIDFISVTDENSVRRSFNLENSYNLAKIRIGDPDQYVTGLHTYVITYKVHGVVGFFENNDEFYWNVTGNDWEVPINDAHVRVNFVDKDFDFDNLRTYSYCGSYGATDDCGSYVVNNRTLYLDPTEWVPVIGYGMTIDLEFPKGFAHKPTIGELIMDNIGEIVIPIFGAILLFLLFRRRWFTYRKFIKQNPLKPEYQEKFSIMETSYLHDKLFTTKDASALIVWFAVHRYIKIHHKKDGSKKDEYSFESLIDPENLNNPKIDQLTDNEKEFLMRLDNFSLTSSKAKVKPFVYSEEEKPAETKTAYSIFSKILTDVTHKLKEEGYVTRRIGYTLSFGGSNSLFGRLFTIGFLFIFISFVPIFLLSVGFFSAIGGIVSFALIFLLVIAFTFTPSIPPFTVKGYEAYRHVKGLYWYIDQAESDRMNVLNERVKTPELYEKLLPYSMIFGLEKKWSKAFEGIIIKDPEWYVSNAPFSSHNFISHMTALGDKSAGGGSHGGGGGSFGGGSSGGGGGGGGGGSW